MTTGKLLNICQRTFRYRVLLSAVGLQACLGAMYAWAVFVTPLRLSLNLPQATVQLPYMVFFIIFPLTAMFAGWFLPRLGTRLAASLGIALVAGGWIISGVAARHPIALVLGNGLIAGLGAGLAYMVPLVVCVRWFPRHKGLVTGIAVAGFGGGAALLSLAARHLLYNLNLDVFTTLQTLGLLFAIVGLPSALSMRLPRDEQALAPRSTDIVPLRQDRRFYALYLGFMCGLAGGFAINSNLRQVWPGANELAGAMAVSAFAIANAAGRIVWGWLHDRLDGMRTLYANLAMQAMLLIFAHGITGNPYLLASFAAMAGFNYGGVLVLYPSQVSRLWGSRHLPRVYGILISANIPASLSPVFAGYMFDLTGSLHPAFMLTGALLLFGLATMAFGMKEVALSKGENPTSQPEPDILC